MAVLWKQPMLRSTCAQWTSMALSLFLKGTVIIFIIGLFFGAWGVTNFQRTASPSCKWWTCAGLQPKCTICLGRSEQPAESWCLVQLKACANRKGAYGRTGEGKVKAAGKSKDLTKGKIVLDVKVSSGFWLLWALMFLDLSRKLFLLQPDSVLLCCGGCQFNYKRDAVHWCSSLSHAGIQSVPGLQFCKTSANGNRQCMDPWGWRAIGTGRAWSPTA